MKRRLPLLASVLVVSFLLSPIAGGFALPHATQLSGMELRVAASSNTKLLTAAGSIRAGGAPMFHGPVACSASAALTVLCSSTPSTQPSAFPSSWTWGNLTPYIPGAIPSQRWGASMAYDSHDGYVVLFGGCSSTCPLGDTWTYSNRKWTDVTPATPNATNTPSARFGAAVADDPSANEVVLFGGTSGFSASSVSYNDTWGFAGGHWTRLCGSCVIGVNEPKSRWNGSMAYDSRDTFPVLFGGEISSGTTISLTLETWEFRGTSWMNVTPAFPTASNTPFPRYLPAFSNNSSSGDAILFGGRGNGLSGPDTWSFAGGTWKQISPGGTTSTPSARWGAAFATGKLLGGFSILFGGCGRQCPNNDTWVFANGTWTQNLTSSLIVSPPTRSDSAVAFDSKDSYFVLFGGLGLNGRVLGETWAFPTPIPPLLLKRFSVLPTPIDSGQALSMRVNASGGIPPYTYVWNGLPGGCIPANSGNYSCSPTQTGAFNVSVKVLDSAGAYASAGPNAVAVNPLPSASGTLSGTRGLVPFQVRFTGSGLGGTPPLAYTWSFGDGATATTPSANHTYAAKGNYTATFWVNDSVGSSAHASFAVHVAPQLVLTGSASPTQINPGQSANFTAAATGGFAPYNFSWAGLPSGCNATYGPRVHCTPNVVGTYTVLLTTTDNASNAKSVFIAFSVVNPAPPGLPLLELIALVSAAVLIPLIAIGVGVYLVYRRRQKKRELPPIHPPFGFKPPKAP